MQLDLRPDDESIFEKRGICRKASIVERCEPKADRYNHSMQSDQPGIMPSTPPVHGLTSARATHIRRNAKAATTDAFLSRDTCKFHTSCRAMSTRATSKTMSTTHITCHRRSCKTWVSKRSGSWYVFAFYTVLEQFCPTRSHGCDKSHCNASARSEATVHTARRPAPP